MNPKYIKITNSRIVTTLLQMHAFQAEMDWMQFSADLVDWMIKQIMKQKIFSFSKVKFGNYSCFNMKQTKNLHFV